MSANSKLSVLVVDDDASIRRMLRGVLEDEGHAVSEAENADRALEALDEGRFDAVLLDIAMRAETEGLDALTKVREKAPDTAVIMVSDRASVSNALKAGQRGAFDFVDKGPADMAEQLLAVLAEAARVTRMRRTAPTARASAGDDASGLGILGQSPAIATLLDQIRRVAPSEGKVLVTGENGSGKELVASALHRLSKRAEGPFVKLNCAALPRDLVESELFGYERGAFTGALQSKKGRLELADQGTLFLDEIGDLSLEAQAKLLRAIETREVERLGGTRTARLDVRMVAATNKDLRAEIEAQRFREDLFHRLNVLPLHVPALRERRTDIRLLAGHFLREFAAAEQRTPKTLSDGALAVLEDYHWPGNVRELRNLMERATILVPGDEVRPEDLTAWLETGGGREETVGLRGEIERREAEAIRRALEAANWNVTQAAASLGIDRTNLHRKMRKYAIERR